MAQTANLEGFFDTFQKFKFGFRFIQFTDNSRACLCPVVLQRINVERRFLIRMNGQQGSDDCRFFECREDSLYPYFSFTMQFADCPTERMRSLLCPESPLSFYAGVHPCRL